MPFAFSLTVDRNRLDPRHTYAVAARISDADGRLMFITDTHNGVDFAGKARIDMGALNLIRTR